MIRRAEIEAAKRLLDEAGFIVFGKNEWQGKLDDEYHQGFADGEHEEKERWEQSEPDEVLVSYCE